MSQLISHTGACGGTLACSTCHVVVAERFYKMLPEPQDEELDMLDLAFGLTPTWVHGSRRNPEPPHPPNLLQPFLPAPDSAARLC